MSYYKEIDGKKYDRGLLDSADQLVAGAGDGRLSKADADTLFDKVKDGGSYTDIEKATVKYIRENYNWTDAGDEHFRDAVRKWAASK